MKGHVQYLVMHTRFMDYNMCVYHRRLCTISLNAASKILEVTVLPATKYLFIYSHSQVLESSYTVKKTSIQVNGLSDLILPPYTKFIVAFVATPLTILLTLPCVSCPYPQLAPYLYCAWQLLSRAGNLT